MPTNASIQPGPTHNPTFIHPERFCGRGLRLVQALARYVPALDGAARGLEAYAEAADNGAVAVTYADEGIGQLQGRTLFGRYLLAVTINHQLSFAFIQPCRTGRVKTYVFSEAAIGNARRF